MYRLLRLQQLGLLNQLRVGQNAFACCHLNEDWVKQMSQLHIKQSSGHGQFLMGIRGFFYATAG
jgi:hypothetical protein